METEIDAINYILDYGFNELMFDVIFLFSLKNIYSILKMEYQMDKINQCNDLVISNFVKKIKIQDFYISVPTNINKEHLSNNKFIKKKVNENKNIIDLTSMCLTKKAWLNINKISNIQYLRGLIILKTLYKKNINIFLCNELLYQKYLK